MAELGDREDLIDARREMRFGPANASPAPVGLPWPWHQPRGAHRTVLFLYSNPFADVAVLRRSFRLVGSIRDSTAAESNSRRD